MRRRFVTLDVFTSQRFAGNPLAVVLDGEGVEDTTMQAIAREFNHPETVFVLAPGRPEHRARVRIFTPMQELPFAGHPTVGTAMLLGLRDGGEIGREIVLEEAIGPVRCRLESNHGTWGGARFDLPRMPAETGPPADAATIAAAVGLAPAEIGFGRHRPSRWSAGTAFTFVPVASLAAIARCRADLARFETAFGSDLTYVYCGEAVEPGHAFHARMFAPALGIPEDPATGSAAAAFAGIVAAGGELADGEHAIAIEQGYEMRRPSVIRLAVRIEAGKLVSASVGGDAVIVTEGAIEA